jgi:putative endonuclease
MTALVKKPAWFVYLLLCRDGSLYCGITSDIPRRVAQHNAGKGAKYVVPARRPVECVWKRRTVDQSQALGLEYWIKQLSAETKGHLVARRTMLRLAKTGEWKIVRAGARRARPAGT